VGASFIIFLRKCGQSIEKKRKWVGSHKQDADSLIGTVARAYSCTFAIFLFKFQYFYIIQNLSQSELSSLKTQGSAVVETPAAPDRYG